MYARHVKEQTITLAVSGMLWHRSLVMIDSETDSLWSHLLGVARSGPLEGTRLKVLPSVMTDWKSWHDSHPETSAVKLVRTDRRFHRRVYKTLAGYVVGMTHGMEARAWPYDQLLKQNIVNDQIGGMPIVIFFESESKSPFIYDRRIDGQTLTFVSSDLGMQDEQSGAQWDTASGRALSPGMEDKRLVPAVGIVSTRRAWHIFHPETEYWKVETVAPES